jgi:hypothetical protein
MGQVTRRGLLIGLGTGAALSAFGVRASATVARSLTLPALVQSSRRIVVVTALAAESRYEELGRRRRIVTDTRVRVEEALAKGERVESELMVRTLGGSVGRVGELVHGQARLALGQACVTFLLQGPEGLHYVNGMAQGHYPLTQDSLRRLMKSPDLGELLDAKSSAVHELVGSELSQAASRIRALSVK